MPQIYHSYNYINFIILEMWVGQEAVYTCRAHRLNAKKKP